MKKQMYLFDMNLVRNAKSKKDAGKIENSHLQRGGIINAHRKLAEEGIQKAKGNDPVSLNEWAAIKLIVEKAKKPGYSILQGPCSNRYIELAEEGFYWLRRGDKIDNKHLAAMATIVNFSRPDYFGDDRRDGKRESWYFHSEWDALNKNRKDV